MSLMTGWGGVVEAINQASVATATDLKIADWTIAAYFFRAEIIEAQAKLQRARGMLVDMGKHPDLDQDPTEGG